MPRVALPLIGPAYTNRSLPLSAQVSKGLYPELNPESRNFASLHAFPGLKLFASLTGKGRGLHKVAATAYAVYGNTLSSIDSDGVATSRGTIVGENQVDFADNGKLLIIVTGATAYIFTVATNTLAEITDPSLVNPTTVDYLNSQFIFDNNGETSTIGEFSTSQVTTPITADNIVNPLDTATTEAYPDDILRVVVFKDIVVFFGADGIDPWWNSGQGNPPFDPVQGLNRPYGLAGRLAVDTTDEFLYFVDDQRTPRRLVGAQVNNIGNPALAQEWDSYVRVDDAVVFAYVIDQKNMCQFNFPAANRSWLYHEESGSWFQLSSGIDNRRHRGQAHLFIYGKNLIQDHSNGNLYELDFDTFTDNGEVVQRKRSTATIHAGLFGEPGKEIFFDKVEFVIETGVGVATGQGSDPQLMVRFTDDGGRTFSAEQWVPVGAGGEYRTLVELFEQGRAVSRIYELAYSEPTRFSLIDAHAEISLGL